MFQNKVIVITGGAGGIGKCIAQEFAKHGAHICIIDSAEGDHYVGDNAPPALSASTNAPMRSSSRHWPSVYLRPSILASCLCPISQTEPAS